MIIKEDPFFLSKGNRSFYFTLRAWECFLDVHAGFTKRVPFSKDRNLITAREAQSLAQSGFTVSQRKISQVHGKTVAVIEKRNGKKIIEADALITSRRGIPLTLHYADCVPVYFFDPVNFCVGIAHAGWRGTALEICREVVRAMSRSYGTNPRHLLAAIGPSIKPCCYEVREDVVSAFKNVFPWKLMRKIFKKKTQKHWMCDLSTANKLVLQSAGVHEKNIAMSQRCTYCDKKNFYSYRRDDGKTGRMMAFIGIV